MPRWSYLTTWLKAVASRIVTFRSLIFRSVSAFCDLLPRFGFTHRTRRFLQEPQLLSLGSTGFVYKLSDAIAVKKCRQGRDDYIASEQKIFAALSDQPPSPYIIQYFHDTANAIFLEFMPGGNLGTLYTSLGTN